MYEIESILYEAEEMGIRMEVIMRASELVESGEVDTFSEACYIVYDSIKKDYEKSN